MLRHNYEYRLIFAENKKEALKMIEKEDLQEACTHPWEVAGFTAAQGGGYDILLRRTHIDSY